MIRTRYPRRSQARGAPSVGEWDAEVFHFTELEGAPGAFIRELDEPDYSLLEVTCPHCGHTHRPYAIPTRPRLTIGGGWRWHGLDYQEPWWEVLTLCPHTDHPYRFTLYVPQ